METTTRARNVNGQAALPADKAVEQPESAPREVIGRLLAPANGAAAPERTEEALSATPRAPLAVFCHEAPDSYVGGHVAQVVRALARRGASVHLFARHAFDLPDEGIVVHAVGGTDEGDAVEQAHEYTRRAGNAFLAKFPPGGGPIKLIGYEWSAAPVLSLLRGLRNLDYSFSTHTLERQRTDGSSPLAQKIAEIEHAALREAKAVLLQGPATAEAARSSVPECSARLAQAHALFPAWDFEADLDPGAIKARYEIGPLDPVILYVGDLDERYGPDLVLKAMPAILRNHAQARLVVVGDGNLFWALRVYARYLLLEHAVRMVGHLQGQPLHELIQAADVVVVPSRESTPWWPIQAAWAARRPVVTTHGTASALVEHERDAVLVYPSENSVVWGVERVLFDASLREALGRNGRQKLDERFGWDALAAQVEELCGVAR